MAVSSRNGPQRSAPAPLTARRLVAAFREAFGMTPAAYCRLTGGR
jgi:AraC-like DNA-binding protein